MAWMPSAVPDRRLGKKYPVEGMKPEKTPPPMPHENGSVTPSTPEVRSCEEAVWKIEVEDFPAFIVVDDKGEDFFAHTGEVTLTIGKRPGL